MKKHISMSETTGTKTTYKYCKNKNYLFLHRNCLVKNDENIIVLFYNNKYF